MDKKIDNRFSRLEGQLKRLHENIANGKDCADVIPQFMAVKGALASAYEEYVRMSLGDCAQDDPEKMKKIIALLVRS